MPLIPTSPIVEGRNVLTAAVYPRSRHWHLDTSLLPQWQTVLRSAREALYAWSPPGWTPASLQVPSCVQQAGCGTISSGAKARTCPLNTTPASHSRPKGLITLFRLPLLCFCQHLQTPDPCAHTFPSDITHPHVLM